MRSSHGYVHHFIPIQFVPNWLGGVPFESSLMSRAYVSFVEAFERAGSRQNGLKKFRKRDSHKLRTSCTRKLVCFVRSVCVHTCDDQLKDISKLDYRKMLPSQEKLIKGKTVGTSHG